MFNFQLANSNGVGCSDGAYTNTYIHSHSIKTEALLFYYFMFICASFGSKISGFQYQAWLSETRNRYKINISKADGIVRDDTQ